MAIYTASATVSYSPVSYMQIVFNWNDHKDIAFTMSWCQHVTKQTDINGWFTTHEWSWKTIKLEKRG